SITTQAPSAASRAASAAGLKNGLLFFDPSFDIQPWYGRPDLTPKKQPRYFVLDLQTAKTSPGKKSSTYSDYEAKPPAPIRGLKGLDGVLDVTLAPSGRSRAFIVYYHKNGG